jgi:hypothetical protein
VGEGGVGVRVKKTKKNSLKKKFKNFWMEGWGRPPLPLYIRHRLLPMFEEEDLFVFLNCVITWTILYTPQV